MDSSLASFSFHVSSFPLLSRTLILYIFLICKYPKFFYEPRQLVKQPVKNTNDEEKNDHNKESGNILYRIVVGGALVRQIKYTNHVSHFKMSAL